LLACFLVNGDIGDFPIVVGCDVYRRLSTFVRDYGIGGRQADVAQLSGRLVVFGASCKKKCRDDGCE